MSNTPQTPAEQSVQFINGEVLSPPKQDSISFVKPYAEQTVVMALEDARSFLQGAEQIVLAALGKALANYLKTGSAVGGANVAKEAAITLVDVNDQAAEGDPASASGLDDPTTSDPTDQPSSKAADPDPAELDQAQIEDARIRTIAGVLPHLAKFHSDVAKTALMFKGDK